MEPNGNAVIEMACETTRIGHMATPSPPLLPNGGMVSEPAAIFKNDATKVEVHRQQPITGAVQQQHAPHAQSSDSQKLTRVKSLDTCRVCGDGPARMHYGVPTCFGCKGFFRRTLKRPKEYTCRYNGNCVVDRYERNSCRHCRFKRCMEVGMDPKAVRPDRDAAGRSHPLRYRRSHASNADLGTTADGTDDTADGPCAMGQAPSNDEWTRKLPVDMRTLLMQIMNIELIIGNGDTNMDSKQLYPLPFDSLRKLLQKPSLLDGKRTEMRYETYRRVHSDEFVAIAHRRLIATIDFVDHLCNLMDVNNIDDKVTMVKSSFAPLWILGCVSATARTTKNRSILCLCQSGYVPRGFDRPQQDHGCEEPYFANRLVDRILDELVEPFRTFNFKEQEVVLMKTIVALNPHIRALSTEASEQIADFRDRVQETLYNVVRESHPKEVASSRFGNLLLFLPGIMLLGNVMYENLQFLQSFGTHQIDPLLNELLDNIEPIECPAASGSGYNTSDEQSSYNSIMRHSTSALSMSSAGTASTSTSGGSSEYLFNDVNRRSSINHSRENLMSLASHSHDDLNSVSYNGDAYSNNNDLFSNLLPQPTNMTLSETESDPDYNMTLRADNYPEMRNAIVQSMEVDNPENCVAITSDYFSDSATIQEQQNRPNFYIDPITANSLGNISHKYLEQHSAATQPTTNFDYCRYTDGAADSQQPRGKYPSGSHICSQSQIGYGACQPGPKQPDPNFMYGINGNTTQPTASQKAVGTRHVFTIEPTKAVYTEHFLRYQTTNMFGHPQPGQDHEIHYEQGSGNCADRINSMAMCQPQQPLNFANEFYPANGLMHRSAHSDLDTTTGNAINATTSNSITKSQSYPYMLQEQFQERRQYDGGAGGV